MRVLVTGGGGFIGRAVVRECEARGYKPEVFGLEHGGITDGEAVAEAVDGQDAVIHLAGLLGTHELFDAVHDAVDVNIHGTVNVLDACVGAGAAYVGIAMPPVFPSVYTATKIAATRLASAYHRTYDLPVSHVRAFNVFGPGQAHGPGHPQKFMPTFAVESWARRPLPIWGDGTQTVDMIFVDDVARMLVDAIGHGDDVTFDGGTGEAWAVGAVAELVNTLTGSPAGVEYLPMRRGETPTRIVATGEGWDLLGWRPELRMRDIAGTVKAYSPVRRMLDA
jgi:UDP-glucose 4-epimerase